MKRKLTLDRFKKGNGEVMGFTVTSVFILFLIFQLTAFIQLSYSLNDMTKILNVVSRSVAVCTSLDDAKEQGQRVAESAITNSNIENIEVSVDYAGGCTDWQPGTYLTVTVGADVKTIEPYITSGVRSKSAVVSVENGSGGTYLGNFRITHYCNCALCCGRWAGGPTASGAMPVAGRTIAVDRNVIPLGSQVVIDGHTYVAEDTGSAIIGNRIDIYVDNHALALRLGMYYTDVYLKR